MHVVMEAAASENSIFLSEGGCKLSVPRVAGRRPEDRGEGGKSSMQERILSVLNSGALGTSLASPAVKTLRFHCRRYAFDPWLGDPACCMVWPKS